MKKRLIISLFLLCAAVFSMTSCSKTAKPDTSSSEQAEVQIPEKDADGNDIKVLEVTDSQGVVVTDENKKPVTEIAAVDKSGNIITDSEGKVSKPKLPEVANKPSGGNNNSNNNSNNGNNNSNNSNNNSNNNNSSNNSNNNNNNNNNNSNNNSDISDDIFVAGDSEYAAFLWFSDAKKSGNDFVFNSVKEDGDVVEMKFKIKSGAKKGKYEIKSINESGHDSAFCDADAKGFDITFCPGYIGVGTEVSETAVPDGNTAFVISSASGQQGDTVTITGSVKNLGEKELAAFNAYIAYDHDALELVSLNRTGTIASSGDFASNVKNAE